MKKETVLITSIGSFSARSVIYSLNKRYRVIGCDINIKEIIPCSKMVDMFYQVPKVKNKNKYLKSIIEICINESVSYIFPLTDVEIDLLNEKRTKFEKETKTILCFSPPKTIEICRDKMKTYMYLKEHDFKNIIKTKLFSETKIDGLDYPVVLKPFNGRSSQGLRIIQNKAEMNVFINESGSELNNYIVQKFIKGKIVTVDVCRDAKHRITVCLPREELLRTYNGAGLSVKIINNKKVIDYSKRIADLLDIVGTVNFEFIMTNKDFYFIECNPRFSGGIGFSFLAGYDFTKNSLKCFQGKKISQLTRIKEKYIAKQYIEIIMS